MAEEKEIPPRNATDIDAVEANTKEAVSAFAERWVPMPSFDVGVEVMDIAQLRDAMGIRATVDWGDPWPAAESLLLNLGFRWSLMGGMRVMLMKERDCFVEVTEWEEAEEIDQPASYPSEQDEMQEQLM